ncbi:HAD-IB family phosphatase [Candidatus Poriferisodalis sp.]|uniref:HAD-IB family phosphatase n=1 Tax=Candidatus Poriferisodalis sp. TaxID=3101277 RepID=UPI003B0254F5
MIAEALAPKRIAITGATGFLGTALVERLLRCVPDCELVLLVRPGRRGDPDRRVQREVLRNEAFERLRAAWDSDFDDICNRRITTVPGDVGIDGLGLAPADLTLLCSCDVIIHAAATVSFDSPLDTSIETNLLGPNRLLEACQREGTAPHFIAVSTCYVAGNRRGSAAEAFLADSPFSMDVDWRAEVAAARRARADLDAASRSPQRLSRLHRAAREELGAAGLPLLAAKTEQLRLEWVDAEMVLAGRSRATSLGWPDVYTYSKALGEQALVELRGDVPVSIVRPSIIESALAEPSPGWIRGFRMAEPLFVSFAKGELDTFPGYPEGIIDVIPVDMVAAAIIAVAARGPVPEPEIFQVASGAVNPLRFKVLTETTMQWFQDHPVYDAKGHPTASTQWRFAGASGLEEQLDRAMTLFDAAEKVVHRLPIRGRNEVTVRLAKRRASLEQMRDYVLLYGAYGRCEALYEIDRTTQLWESLPQADRDTFGFDPRVIDWASYIAEVHLPSVITQARVKTTPQPRTGPSRNERLRSAVLDPKRHFAAFDLENTLIASNVVETYAWLATRRLDTPQRVRFALRTLAEAPGLWRRDRRDRTDFLRYFYRRYKGAPVSRLDADAAEMLSYLFLTKAFPAGLRRVREHRAAGHRTVLITGALELAVQPLAPLFDHIIAARIDSRNGRYTGEMIDVPPTGEVRAQVMVDWAAREGLELAQGVAYADAASDMPMLEAVGYPVAVNPETRLVTIADKRGWLCENWERAPGGPRPLLPIAPPSRARAKFDRRVPRRRQPHRTDAGRRDSGTADPRHLSRRARAGAATSGRPTGPTGPHLP